MMSDFHVHCNFSADSDTKPELMINSAIEHNLEYMCFTDHQDWDFPDDPDLFTFDTDKYFETIDNFKKIYAGKINILIGVELGLQTHLSKDYKAYLSKYPFDFVIGSSHLVNHLDPYYPKYFHGRNEADAYMEYFKSIIDNVKAFDDFDVYGHIDYVVRYGPNKNKFYEYNTYGDIIDEILKLLISKGKGIEINTAGFKYGLGHPNPTEDVIKRYKELGGEIITIGSDGHQPEHLAYDFDKVPIILKDCGFDYFTIFKKRNAEFIKL